MSIEDAYIELRKVNKLRQEIITKLSKENAKLKEALEEIRGISDNYNLTVCKRREQITNKINEVLKNDGN